MNAPSPHRGKSTLPPLHPSLAKLDPDPKELRYALDLLQSFIKVEKEVTNGGPKRSAHKIMDIMADGRIRTANDIAFRMDIAPDNASAQLGALAKAGLLSVDREAIPFIYRIAAIG